MAEYEDLGPYRLVYAPSRPTPLQEVFLRLAAKEGFYGGAAGGGKSWGLLAAALQYADVPGYAAILFRRTFPELTQPGGLIPKSEEWLGGTNAIWNGNDHQWTFPSGATLTFGHMQHDKDRFNYKSGEYQFVGFDEVTSFTEVQYIYLRSRLRRLSSPQPNTQPTPDGWTVDRVPLRIRAASNPGGVGHEWARTRFVDKHTRHPGVAFLPARLSDNPYLDQDTYIENLMELSELDRRRLLEGDWEVAEAGGIFQRAWFGLLESTPSPGAFRNVRYWDLAGTEPSPANPDPDYTVGLRYLYDQTAKLGVVFDIARFRASSGTVEQAILRAAHEDGRATTIVIEQEPGSSGKAVVEHYQRLLDGYEVRGHRVTGDKATRARPVAAAAEQGRVQCVRAAWLPSFLAELEAFDYGEHDDQVDALSGAHEYVTSEKRVKLTVSVPQARIPTVQR